MLKRLTKKPDLCRIDLTFEDALPDETVEIAFADSPTTGMRVVNAIATTRETALARSFRLLDLQPVALLKVLLPL